MKVKRALVSVSDKKGILEFACELRNLGIEIISTGGTAKILREKIPVTGVSEVTNFPEMLDVGKEACILKVAENIRMGNGIMVRGRETVIWQPESGCHINCPFGCVGWGRVRVVTHGSNLPRHGTETARRDAGFTQSGVRAAHKAVIPAGENPALGIVCSPR